MPVAMLNVEDEPALSASQAYLADTNVLAMLELGLEATLLQLQKTPTPTQSPMDFLAKW
jgi:hypothetical protein